MTKKEKEKIIDVLDLWLKNAISFSKGFDFQKRKDALNELECRIDRITFLSEFLIECGFITTEKYLQIAEETEKIVKEVWGNK